MTILTPVGKSEPTSPAIPETPKTPRTRSPKERLDRIEARKRVRQAELEEKAQAARERVEAEVEARRESAAIRKFDLYDQQEAHRAPQFQIDQRGTLFLLGALAVVTFLTTAVLTADGTIGAAASARFAIEWFGYILFGAFEVAILVFMLMYYVLGSRVDYDGNRVPAIQWFWAMVATAGITVALSVYHVLDLYSYDWYSIDMWFGIGIRLAVSLMFVTVSKGVANVLFAKAINL